MMNDVTIPIDVVAGSPTMSAAIMCVSEREGIPTGEAALLILRVAAREAMARKMGKDDDSEKKVS